MKKYMKEMSEVRVVWESEGFMGNTVVLWETLTGETLTGETLRGRVSGMDGFMYVVRTVDPNERLVFLLKGFFC